MFAERDVVLCEAVAAVHHESDTGAEGLVRTAAYACGGIHVWAEVYRAGAVAEGGVRGGEDAAGVE